jgi:hypothetical protein
MSGISNVKRTDGEPHDRLTRICNRMIDALQADPEYQGDQCCVFLDSAEMGGMVFHGYDEWGEAVAAVFAHMAAMFEANGKKLMVVPIGHD